MISVGGAVRDPALAVMVTVLLPTGVPGLPCALLPPPPQAGIHKAANDKKATKLNTRIARRDFRFPADSSQPEKSGKHQGVKETAAASKWILSKLAEGPLVAMVSVSLVAEAAAKLQVAPAGNPVQL